MTRKGNFRMPFDPMAGEQIIPRSGKQWKILRKEKELEERKLATKQRLAANRAKQAKLAQANAAKTPKRKPKSKRRK